MELLFPLLILVLLVPMFLGIRRQKKEMAKTAELQESLKVGDRVMTTAGLYGTVAALGDTTVDLEVAPGVVTTWSRLVVREHVTEDVDADSVDTETVDTDSVDAGTDVTDSSVLDETPEQTRRRLDQD